MIDQKTIQYIAKLARLHVSEEEAKLYGEQLSKVLSHFEQISQVETKGIEPLVTPTDMKSYWRDDQVQQEFTAEEMTSNAPHRTGNLFTVPPVV